MAGAFQLVGLFPRRGDSPVVASERCERLVGDAAAQQRGSSAKQAVATDEMVVEEAKRTTGIDSHEPEIDLGELEGHWVDVDAVETTADDLP